MIRKASAMSHLLRTALAAAAIVAGAALYAGFAASSPPAAAAIHRGFNTFPWIYRAQTLNGDRRQFDYGRLFPYTAAFTPAHFSALREAGADFVRAIVEPSPFLLVSPEQREKLVADVITETGKASGPGLTVIIDLHPRETVADWSAQTILTHAELKQGYRAAVVAFAQALRKKRQGSYILELMNEPPGGYGESDGYGWLAFQSQLVKAARAVAPVLPIVVSGDRGGGPDGLRRLDVAAIDDPGILYSFHYYLPMAITHQGAKWTSKAWRQYLTGVSYPPAPSEGAASLARVRDAVLSDKSLDGATRQKVWNEAQTALQDYFHNQAGSIQADFARIAAWAREHRTAFSHFAGRIRCLSPRRAHRHRDQLDAGCSQASEDQGFAWAFFNYAPFDENGQGFSLLRMSGPHPNEVEPRMLSGGLGLRAP